MIRWVLRGRRRSLTAFIAGDASGAVIQNVTTEADSFIAGDQRGGVIKDVVHRPGPEHPRPHHKKGKEQQRDGNGHGRQT